MPDLRFSVERPPSSPSFPRRRDAILNINVIPAKAGTQARLCLCDAAYKAGACRCSAIKSLSEFLVAISRTDLGFPPQPALEKSGAGMTGWRG